MKKKDLLSVDIVVIQNPVWIRFQCPYCREDIKIDYNDFCDEVGEPCDWNSSEIECSQCNETIRIDAAEWY